MSMDPIQMAALTPAQQPSGWLIAANEVLALSSAELQRLMQEEQQSNPALELEERPVCPGCGRALHEERCPHCQALAPPAEAGPIDPPLLDEGPLWPAGMSGGQADEWVDPLLLVPAQVDWKEHLQVQLELHFSAEDAPLIEYLVGSLDDDGYLDSGALVEAAQLFEVPVHQVQSVLEVLQAQEPAGIGAHDVQECLLLQLHRLEADDAQRAVMAQIITDHLTLLGQGRYPELARQLGIARAQVEAACVLVKQHLTPFPLRGYLGPDLQAGDRPTSTLVPDVIITRRSAEEGGGYEVEIAEAERFGLSINPVYLQAARALRGSRDASAQHVQEYLARTRLFMTTIKRRWETLDSITCCLIELQPDFLTQGRDTLHDLTRARVAEHLGLHASTVSRATSDKYVMLPTAEVVPFSLFFESNWSVKAVVKEIISQETRPLSDQQVTELLQERGILLARRTVAKYREQLGFLPSSLRRAAAAPLSSTARPAGETREQPSGGRPHATRSLN